MKHIIDVAKIPFRNLAKKEDIDIRLLIFFKVSMKSPAYPGSSAIPLWNNKFMYDKIF